MTAERDIWTEPSNEGIYDSDEAEEQAAQAHLDQVK